MVEKQKVIFLLDSGSCFSVLPFSHGSRSNNKVIIQGISGQPLEHYFSQPLVCSWKELQFCLSHFSLSPWNSSAPAGMGFTISTKCSNSTPPRWLPLLLPSSGTSATSPTPLSPHCQHEAPTWVIALLPNSSLVLVSEQGVVWSGDLR
jgi:hypothetical protein